MAKLGESDAIVRHPPNTPVPLPATFPQRNERSVPTLEPAPSTGQMNHAQLLVKTRAVRGPAPPRNIPSLLSDHRDVVGTPCERHRGRESAHGGNKGRVTERGDAGANISSRILGGGAECSYPLGWWSDAGDRPTLLAARFGGACGDGGMPLSMNCGCVDGAIFWHVKGRLFPSLCWAGRVEMWSFQLSDGLKVMWWQRQCCSLGTPASGNYMRLLLQSISRSYFVGAFRQSLPIRKLFLIAILKFPSWSTSRPSLHRVYTVS